MEQVYKDYKPLFTDDGTTGPLSTHAKRYGWAAIIADLAQSSKSGYGLSKIEDVLNAPIGSVFVELMRRKEMNRILERMRTQSEAQQKQRRR